MTAPAKGAALVHVVDDDDLVRTALSRLLRSGGYVPKPCGDPEQFLEEVGSGGAACILLDITMPRMTGLQVQARLKARGNTIPIIAVSARDDEETRRRAHELGARGFLRKPIDDQALLDMIEWLVQSERTAFGPDPHT